MVLYKPTNEDVEEIKQINGWQGVEQNDYISTMLPLIFDHVKTECNNDFGHVEDVPPEIPSGVKIYMAKVIEFNRNKMGVKSRKMGSVSYSYDVEFPNSMDRYIRPYRRLRFRAQR